MFIIELNKYIYSSLVMEDKEEWKKQEIPEKINHPDRNSSIDSMASRMYRENSIFLQVPLWRNFSLLIG